MLKAGFSRVDITPPLGNYMPGYFEERYAEGILDPLQLNALAVSDGTQTVLVVAADLLMITRVYAEELRTLISEKTQIPAQNVLITCLHQHTAVDIRDRANKKTTLMRDGTFLDVLYRKFADVAQMAIADLEEAEVSVGQMQAAEPLSFVRRYFMQDGTVATNPTNYGEIDRACYTADNTVRLCRFRRKEGKNIALVNFSTHADVVHGKRFSADWPGFTRSFVEADLENVCCIATVGVQGDTNHLDFKSGNLRDGYSHSRHMGRVIADAVGKLWENTTPCNACGIHADICEVTSRTRLDGIDDYDYAQQILNTRINREGKRATMAEMGNASRVTRMRNMPIFQKIPVTVQNLGQIGFVGFGGEPFTRYADTIREACPDRFVVAFCCANGGEGYLPTKVAFEEGGYEASSSPFMPTLEADCVNAAIGMLKK